MLTKKILKYVRKAEKARLVGNGYLSDKYRAAAIALTKQCRNVTEDEFHQVFSHAIIEARDTYWLVMHAKEQWGTPDDTLRVVDVSDPPVHHETINEYLRKRRTI